jgi:hypothetical protein
MGTEVSDSSERYACRTCGAHSHLSRRCFVCGSDELVRIEDAAAVEALLDHITAPAGDSRWCAAVLARARGPRMRLGRSRR